ncbi:MAG: DUF3131 domain-containing protein [Candidatus Kapaibacterium sp.]|nr:MAG: DUF3131 domain-containing protein [Candidatus Kapabacteria bacterium]
MNFTQGLKAARSRIVIILGLLTSVGIIVGIDSSDLTIAKNQRLLRGLTTSGNVFLVDTSKGIPAPPSSDLTPQEQEFARIAWRYFERNYQEQTGLVNSVDQYPASTMWDTGSYLMGVISAYKLGVIPEEVFQKRISTCLQALAGLPLYDKELPNKSYNTKTKQMANYDNTPSPRGIGWSAIDVGRLFVPMNILTWEYPEFAGQVRGVIKRFRFSHVVQGGIMFGAVVGDSNRTEYPQEGRIGYEEYAAKSYSIMGTDVFGALKYDDFLQYENIYGVQIPTDSRTPDRYKAFNYVVSEPYILDGLEYGFDNYSREFAYRVYRAQEERFNRTGILTAVSEDNIDTVPYFVYNTVFTAGKQWSCITDKGEDVSQFRSMSTKAVFGWYSLYQTPYTKKLLEKTISLYDPEKGWYSGLYEKTGKPNKAITCNTNAIILEALCYKKFGPHLKLLN